MKNSIRILFLLCISFFLSGKKIVNAQDTLFSQNFEGTATIYTNGVVMQGGTPATIPAVQTWGSNSSSDNSSVLHRDDTQGAWISNDDNCGNSDAPFPACAANGSTYSALFDNFDAGSFNTGNIISPIMDLSGVASACSVSFSFYYFIGDCNTAFDASLTLQFNNGSGYATVWSDNTGCTGGWNNVTINIPSADFTNSFNFQFIASAGLYVLDYYPVGIDEIVISSPVGASISVTNVTCFGDSNGTATATPNGGTGPYTYLWSDPNEQSSATATGLKAGTYTVTVTDNTGCSGTAAATVTQPNLLAGVGINEHEVTCNGGADGSATLGTWGGTMPYTYSWNGGPFSTTNATMSGLSAGTYSVTVTDANGCTATHTVLIRQPAPLRDSIVTSKTLNVKCYGVNYGTAQMGARYGTIPYTYLWSNSLTNAEVTTLSPGTYTVSVTDNCGASGSATVTITGPATALAQTTTVNKNVTCFGGNDGGATSNPSGGTIPYTYLWNTGETNQTITDFIAGNHLSTLKDAHGCTVITPTIITQPAAIKTNIPTPSCVGGGKGTVKITVSGGSPAYTYNWSNSTHNSSMTVASGTYSVTVLDAHGCSATNSVTFSCSEAPPHRDGEVGGDNGNCCPLMNEAVVYPNPNSGQFTIAGLENGMAVEMYDYTGRKISTVSASDKTMLLNIANQANGIYLIRILDKDGNLVGQKKVVKTN